MNKKNVLIGVLLLAIGLVAGAFYGDRYGLTAPGRNIAQQSKASVSADQWCGRGATLIGWIGEWDDTAVCVNNRTGRIFLIEYVG